MHIDSENDINLPVFFIVPQFSFIDCTTSVEQRSPSVPLTHNEIPHVLIILGILGSIQLPQHPYMCPSSMLPERRAHVIHNTKTQVNVKEDERKS